MDGFFGEWKLDQVWDGETSLEMPPDGRRVLKLTVGKDPKGGDLQLSFKIANSVNGRVKVVGQETDTCLIVETGPFMSTRMMPPPALQPIENVISSKKIAKMELVQEKSLLISGPEMKIQCSRMAR